MSFDLEGFAQRRMHSLHNRYFLVRGVLAAYFNRLA
jgi:hypothetical protein